MKSKKIIMRLPGSIQGLKNMVAYINTISDTGSMRMVEIGCFAGDSTVIFIEAFKHVTAIDPWKSGIGDITDMCDMDGIYKKFLKKIDPAVKWKTFIDDAGEVIEKEMKNCKIIKDFSYNYIKTLSKSKKYDMVYIDGSHKYADTIRDIKDWAPRIKKGGFICGHDYRKKFPGVVKAVGEYFKKKPDKVFKDSSWLIRV